MAKVFTGQPSEGLASLQRLIPAVQRQPIPEPRAALDLVLARSTLFLGDLASAQNYARRALAQAVALGSPEGKVLRLRSTALLAEILLDRRTAPLDADARAALGFAQEAERLAAALNDAAARSTARLAQARAHLRLGDASAAARMLGEGPSGSNAAPATALVRGEIALHLGLPEDAVRWFAAAERSASPEVQRLALLYLAELDGRRGAFGDAERGFRAVLAQFEHTLHEAGADEALLLQRGHEPRAVRGLVRALVAQRRTRDAFAIQDGYRARLLALYRGRVVARSDGRSPVGRILDSLRATRDSLSRPDATPTRSRLAARLFALQSRLARLQPVPPATPTDVASLQRRLRKDGRVLVAYVLDPDRPYDDVPAVSYAFVVSPDSVRAVRLAVSSADLAARIASVSDIFASGRRGMTRAAFDVAALHALYRDLVAPLGLGAEQHVTIVPDGPLFALPFGALVTRPAGRFDVAGAHFLVQDHALTTELAGALLLSPPHQAPTDSMLVLARSGYAGAHLPDLASVDAEARYLSRWPDASVLRGGEAVETAFATHAPRARFVHLAAHTDVAARSPLDYTFLFWPADGSSGRLTLHQMLLTPLSADLVVLSGCSTARGEMHEGEGMLGLQYGVRSAGARSVLATHWVADDASTARVLTGFYDRLRHGLGRDEALQLAQTAYLDHAKGMARSPYFWAAPVLYGEAGPVSMPPSPARFWVVLVGAIALAGALALLYRLTRNRYGRRPQS